MCIRDSLNGELLKELPECTSPNYTFCDIDPSKLLLENVEKSFHGNYSCIGMNEAGWGSISPNTELIVYCKYTYHLCSLHVHLSLCNIRAPATAFTVTHLYINGN